MTQESHSSEALDLAFAAMAHPKRRAMIATLSFRPATVSQLGDEHQVSLPAIHKHIRMLEEAQLIQRKKVGRVNFVALNRDGLKMAQGWLGQFHAYWGSNAETLENYIANLSNE